MSEYRDDPLADAVFRTPEGQASVVGILTAGVVTVPMLVAWSVINPNSDIKEEEYRISGLEKQQDSLTDSAQILEERGFGDLADQLYDQSEFLSTEISSAKEAVPPHLAGDIAIVSLLSAPFIIGALAGFIAYKKLKKQTY